MNATFGTFALYILRLRCLAIQNTWKKTAFDFFGNVVFVVLDCVQLFWWFSSKRSQNIGRFHRKENTNFPKRRLVRSKFVLSSSALLFSLVVWKKNCSEKLLRSLYLGTLRDFHSNAESHFGCARFRRLRLVLWLFTSCVWDVLRYRILRKKQLLIFFGNVVFVVLGCVQLFWWFSSKRSQNIGRFHRKENTNFPKRRLVRSKFVCLSSALLYSLAVTTKMVLRPSWDLSTRNNTCILFKCRIAFRLRQFSNATFGTLALYILRLRCLGISNTYKNSFCFLSKTETIQTTLSTFQKCLFELCSALLGSTRLDSLVVNKISCFENLMRSLYMKQYVFFVQMQRHLLAAIFFERYFRYYGSLHPAFEMSSVIEYL